MTELKYEMGLRIKEKRKVLRFTQEEISEKLNISVKHFSEVERGISGLSLENLVKLSEILGVSIDYIVKGQKSDKWDGIESTLNSVPSNKEQYIRELIYLGVELAKKDN